MAWAQVVTEQIGGQLINVDGKTAGGSRDRNQNRNPLHRVSAWAGQNHFVLGPEAIAEKSNEMTAIPKLLALLELKNCLVAIDAMGYQKPMAAQIVELGVDYVLGLKGNQSSLHEAMVEFTCYQVRMDLAGNVYSTK